MDYRSLGRTGVQVSPLCLGGMLFGEQTDEAEALTIIDRALDAGLNFVDTANIYSRGRSEEIIGRALRRNGRRAQVVLATKVHSRMDDHDPKAWGNSRRHILEQCEALLRRLQTEVIDLYQLHRPLSTVPIDETLRALDDLVRSGKVRYLGTSTFAAWQLSVLYIPSPARQRPHRACCPDRACSARADRHRRASPSPWRLRLVA